MHRIAVCVQYQGQQYFGWQQQPGLDTIQSRIEHALFKLTENKISIYCAGRTDRGVHALGQVFHFDTDFNRPLKNWLEGLNRFLPHDIVVRHVQEVDENFHARFSAHARTYHYVIYNSRVPHAFNYPFVTRISYQLDTELMDQASKVLIGEHDFSSFRGADCQSKSPMREVKDIQVRRHGQYVRMEITANAFLHHMVRNIMGTLIEVGRGKASPEWVEKTLEACDRHVAGFMAPASGLYFIKAHYMMVNLGENIIDGVNGFWANFS